MTKSNKQKYADRYGYHVFDGSGHYDPSRPPAWSKIRAVQALLIGPERCDWVLWMDADAVIMNSNIRIEDFLPADSSKDMIVVSDKNGGYNSGVFLFRNSMWSTQFLEEWWNMNDFVRPPGLSLSGDNAALKALLRTMEQRNVFHDHVLAPPRCTINSFAHFLTVGESKHIMEHLTEQTWYYDNEHYHKGDFIAHIPGFDNKAECLRLLLREAR
jgi:galactosyl transferase GMA12/MNN10 family